MSPQWPKWANDTSAVSPTPTGIYSLKLRFRYLGAWHGDLTGKYNYPRPATIEQRLSAQRAAQPTIGLRKYELGAARDFHAFSYSQLFKSCEAKAHPTIETTSKCHVPGILVHEPLSKSC